MGAPTWQDVFDIENLFQNGNLLNLDSAAIQSQYAASPKMKALMASFQKQLDASEQIDSIYDNLINLKTASGSSLDVWGRILAISRYLNGEEAQTTWPDEYYQLLLFYKALANISAADSDTINRLLKELFDGSLFVTDKQNMTIRINLEFLTSDVQKALLRAYGLLCRGAGVGWELYEQDPDGVFGFDGSLNQPFDQAPFNSNGIIKFTVNPG